MRYQKRLFHESLEVRRALDGSGLGAGEPLPDFNLQDVNPTSPTFGQTVSPRQFEGQTTAWYFIHST